MSKSKQTFLYFRAGGLKFLNECVAKADKGSRIRKDREREQSINLGKEEFREGSFNRTELGISHSIHSPFILNFLRKSNEFSTESHYLPKII